MYIERFKEALIYLRDDASISLPICNKDKEWLFFYYLKDKGNGTFIVERVLDIYERNRESGIIKKLDVEDVLAKSGIDMKADFQFFLSPVEARDYRKSYLCLYEQYYESKNEQIPTELYKLFIAQVPYSPLRDLYMYLSKDYVV